MATPRRPWTRDELLVALGMYLRLPFGQLNQRNAEVIRVAGLLSRTPSALAMKLGNFASLDDSIARAGLEHAARADRELWDELQSDWPATADAIARANARLGDASSVDDDLPQPTAVGEDVIAETKVRRGQALFRASVLSAYQGRCCVTGLDNPRLLNASHILPWRDDPANRLNPRNGLCLSALHDRAFDRGLITFDQELRLVLSSQIQSSDNPFFRASFSDYVGERIAVPEKFAPRLDFIAYHREHIFLG